MVLNHSLLAVLLLRVVAAQQSAQWTFAGFLPASTTKGTRIPPRSGFADVAVRYKEERTDPPTLAPIAPPTLAPIAPPTQTPIAPPTQTPIAPSPVSPAPQTESPIDAATDLPTGAPTSPSMNPSGSISPSQAPTISSMPSSLCNVGCPDDGINGFSTIDDLNCQIQYDWNQVQRGESVTVPPTYIVCPNTVFNMTSSLTLLLSNSVLLCGADGAFSNKCVLANGSVEIQNLDSVAIRGFTFRSSSLLHTGAGSLSVQDCFFRGDFVVGGPVVMAAGTTRTSLLDCIFKAMGYIASSDTSNSTITVGALILASQSALELDRVKIIGTVVSTEATVLDLIRAENSAITIKDCNLLQNSANNILVGQGASTIVLSGTTFKRNDFANALSFEGTVDVTMDDCVVAGNNYSTSVLSISSQGDKTMAMSNSRLNNNTGGMSVATLRGTAQFQSVSFLSNVAQIGIETFSEVVMDNVQWTANEAEWHLYVRSGGSLSFGDASIITQNLAAVAVFFLESNAYCKLRNTQVISNNVTEFHLMSVLEFSALHLMNATISSNEIANTAIFAYSSSQVHLDAVTVSDNVIEKSLFRFTTNSTLEASYVTVTNNRNRDDLVFGDTGSSISVSASNFVNNWVTGGVLVVSNGTASYKDVGLTNNVGGTAGDEMLQSSQGSTVTLNSVDVHSNTFDGFARVTGASRLDANLVFVSGHVGLSKGNTSSWEVYAVSNASSLVLSNSVINSTVSSALVHASNASLVTVNGLQIFGIPSSTAGPLYGIIGDGTSTTKLTSVCFNGGDYTYPVWSQNADLFSYSNVSGTTDLVIDNTANCSAMFVQEECIDFDTDSCGPFYTLAPIADTRAPVAPPTPSPTPPPPFFSAACGFTSTTGQWWWWWWCMFAIAMGAYVL